MKPEYKTEAELKPILDDLNRRYNWFVVTKEVEGQEPETFHAIELIVKMGYFLVFNRMCATPAWVEDYIVDFVKITENAVVFTCRDGVTYTVTGENKRNLAHKDTATGSIDDPTSLISWERSKITEDGNTYIVLDFNKAGAISGISELKIINFMETNLDGLSIHRQCCRTIYLKANANKLDFFDPVEIGLFNLETEKIMTAKTFFFDVSFSEEESNTIRKLLNVMKAKT